MPYAVVTAIYAVCIALSRQASSSDATVAAAIGFDLTVTAAAVFWLLAVRPGRVPPRALWPLVALGFVAAKFLVGLRALGAVGIVAELAVVGLVAVRIRRIVRTTRALRRAGHGLTAALQAAIADVLPAAVASALAVELSAMILAATGWFARPPEGFSMHRQSGYILLLGTLLAVVAIETAVVHVALARVWSPTAAIVATVLSSYGFLWLVGDTHAVRLSPLRITPDGLVIERGVRARVVVPLAAVASATPVTDKVVGATDLSFLGPNLLLTLHSPVHVRGLFGRLRATDKLTLSIDDRDALLARLL